MYGLEFLCHSALLVVIHNLNSVRVSVSPFKANAPLVIDTHAVLALAIPFQSLQPISWQSRERSDIRRRIDHVQLAKSRALYRLEPAHEVSSEKVLGVGAAEGPDHNSKTILIFVKCKAVQYCAI
jgi:hypothetical protein